MSEDGQAAIETSETVAPIIDETGKFVDGWQNALPENIRAEKCLNGFTDIAGMAKSLVHAQRMVGTNKVVLPSDKSLPEEWETFYNAVGRPKTKDDYAFTIPEKLKGNYDEKTVAAAKETFHKLGLTQKQAEGIFNLNNSLTEQAHQFIAAQSEKAKADAEAQLRGKWKDNFDANMHIANRIISENTDAATKDKLLAKIGNDPDVAEFLATVGLKFMEHKPIIAADTNAPFEVQQQISELMNTTAYSNATHPDHKSTVQRVQALFNQKNALKK